MFRMSSRSLERTKEIMKRNRDRLMKLHNVVGVGIGRKVVGGRLSDRVAIRIYVVKKVPPERLSEEQHIPKKVEGVPTDVVEVGEIRRLGEDAHETRLA